jgi:hypothetical protein
MSILLSEKIQLLHDEVFSLLRPNPESEEAKALFRDLTLTLIKTLKMLTGASEIEVVQAEMDRHNYAIVLSTRCHGLGIYFRFIYAINFEIWLEPFFEKMHDSAMHQVVVHRYEEQEIEGINDSAMRELWAEFVKLSAQWRADGMEQIKIVMGRGYNDPATGEKLFSDYFATENDFIVQNEASAKKWYQQCVLFKRFLAGVK